MHAHFEQVEWGPVYLASGVTTVRDCGNETDFVLAVRDAMGAQGAFVANNNVVSQSVPHFHLHVVPRVKKDGLRGFFWPRRKYREGEAESAAAAIREALAGG